MAQRPKNTDQFWATFGLPQAEPEELARHRATQVMAANKQAMDKGLYRNTEDRVGQAFGNSLGGMFRAVMEGRQGDLISDREKKLYAAKQEVEAQAKYLNKTEWKGLKYEEKELAYQKLASESMAQFGLTEEQYAVNKAIGQKEEAIRLREKKHEQLDLDITHGHQQTDYNTERYRDAVRGNEVGDKYDMRDRAEADESRQIAQGNARRQGVKTIYTPGSDDPNSGREAYIRPDGTAITTDGTKLPLGSYTTDRPSREAKSRASGGTYSDTQAGAIRAQASNLGSMARSSRGILEVLAADAVMDGGVETLGLGGKAVKTGRRIADNIATLVREGKGTYNILIENSEGKAVGTEASLVNGKALRRKGPMRDEWKAIENNPKLDQMLREKGMSVAQYQSLVMTMAYAKARSNEPGNTRLSDADVANAIRELGTDATNPETIRRIFMQNITEARKKFEDSWTQVPTELRPEIMNAEYMPRLQNDLNMFDAIAYDRPAGTSANPSEALQKSPIVEKTNNELRFGPPGSPTAPAGEYQAKPIGDDQYSKDMGDLFGNP